MVIPCIDFMEGKVVQLVQGKTKALEIDDLDAVIQRFSPFPELQVIDLDAAMGRGANTTLVARVAERKKIRAGGGVRSVEKAEELVELGAAKVIIGTAAFDSGDINERFLRALKQKLGPERIIIALDSRGGEIVVRGWQQGSGLTAEAVIPKLEPYCSGFLCTYVDKEGTMQGTNLDWFRHLRSLTNHEITAAGGIGTIEEIEELDRLSIHAALGMAIYTGKLPMEALLRFQTRD